MDLLVLVMTGCLEDVEEITSRRVNSLSPFGPVVMEEQGIGISVDEFKERKANNTMSGHVGLLNPLADRRGHGNLKLLTSHRT